MGPVKECRNQARQATADGLEAEFVRRYLRQRAVATALADTVRRADAAMRLEMWLRRPGGGTI